jgi:hypothetical protein
MVSCGVTIMNKDLPSPEYLRERLRYCHETGKLFWRKHPDMPNSWNARWAGKEAFRAFHRDGYKSGGINGRTLLAHRVIWAIVNGEWPKSEIDHIDHFRSNNKIENLREATSSENSRNRSKNSNNTSGVCGVYFYKKTKKWMSYIKIEGKLNYLGYYEDLDEAVSARKAEERKHGFHENHGM